MNELLVLPEYGEEGLCGHVESCYVTFASKSNPGHAQRLLTVRRTASLMDSTGGALVERTQVADTVTRVFVNTDEGDWKGVTDCFAPKVLFDMSSLTGTKPSRVSSKKIADQWESGLRGLAAVHHQIGNVLVHVEGAEAGAFCYATATHYFPNPTGNDTRTFVGTYDFHLVRGEDGWRIDMFRFNLKFTQGNPLLAELARKAARRQ